MDKKLIDKKIIDNILIDTSEDIYIDNFINKVNTLGTENNKAFFVQNYNDVKTQINHIDTILNKPPSIDSELNIKMLFGMLNEYTNVINEEDITIKDYKNIMDLVSTIENKLKNEKITISEIN
jgi:hypothetical protein